MTQKKKAGRSRLDVHTLDPLRDPRWAELIEHHPLASVYHTPGWLTSLARTYGYEPVVYTTNGPSQSLTNGIVFCRINSWLTGRRLVSLPFSDHCDPLVDNTETLSILLSWVSGGLERQGWRYVEMRPLFVCDLEASIKAPACQSFCWHTLDLHPDGETVFRHFHKNAVRSPIRRAMREMLEYEEGVSEPLLFKFYNLLLLTRRRHQIPPQPLAWFRNLIDYLGDRLSIHVASKDGQPIASILTLSYKNSLFYKYSCSDARFRNLGGTPFLLWKAVQQAKALGADHFDLGRSDLENCGLQVFKDRLGATRASLKYYRFPHCAPETSIPRWGIRIARQVYSRLPGPILPLVGKLMYKHAG